MLRYGAPFGEAQGRPGHEERFVTSSGPVARLALALTEWTERWVPDAFIFALLATVLVVVAALRRDAVDARCRSSTPGAAASGS